MTHDTGDEHEETGEEPTGNERTVDDQPNDESDHAAEQASDPGVGADGDDAETDELREQLARMREEADRIASLGTGDEQVDAAEKFAEDAGALDERIGAAARDADDDRSV